MLRVAHISSPDVQPDPPRIAVIGSALLELFAPRAGQRLSDVDTLALDASGSATIMAAVAQRLGARVSLVTAVGDDELGAEWKRRAAAGGIDTSAVVSVPGQMTPIAISTVDAQGDKQYAFYRFRGICDPLDELALTATLEAEVVAADMLVLTEAVIRGERSRAVVSQLLDARGEAPTVLAVNYRPASWSDEATAASTLAAFADRVAITCCNRAEYELLDPLLTSREILFETLGADGVNVHVGRHARHIPARRLPEVVLDTGAGDTFCAAATVALAEGRDPVTAARFASAAAAIAIGRPGLAEAAPTRAEVEALIASSTTSSEETA